jgi:hypothetical protein
VLINNKVEGSGTAWLFSVYAGEKADGALSIANVVISSGGISRRFAGSVISENRNPVASEMKIPPSTGTGAG